MDKEEFRIKQEEINRLIEHKDYKGAMEVVDSIDWRRVKKVRTLCVVGEIYAANKRYEDAKEIFLLAYHRAPIGKNILYRLVEVALKMGDIDEAEEFFQEYMEVAPDDNVHYVLQYKISRARRASLNEQIKILEEYKESEFTEKWSYELAKLYYKAGDKEKCLDLCNEIVLWFSEGKYVMKALDLKMRMGALTGAEKEKYEQQFIPKLITPEEAQALKENTEDGQETQEPAAEGAEQEADELQGSEDEPKISSILIGNEKDLSSAETLQEKISKGIRDIFGSKKKEENEEEIPEDSVQEDAAEEMLKSTSDTEYTDVPQLEPEDGKAAKPDFSATMKMPELKIPDSMKNIDLNEALVAPEIPAPNIPIPNFISGAEDTPEETADTDSSDFDFNLEDTILAAASAQGIEIPDAPPVPVKEEEEEPEEAGEAYEEAYMDEAEEPGESMDADAPDMNTEDEEEEILSEEVLKEAEEEFLHGPAARAEKEPEPAIEPEEVYEEPVEEEEYPEEYVEAPEYEEEDEFSDLEDEEEEENTEIPSLEPEELLPQEIASKRKKDEKELDDDEFIRSILKKEVRREKTIFDEVPDELMEMSGNQADEEAEPEEEYEEYEEEPETEEPAEEPVPEAEPPRKKPASQEEELEQFIESMQPKADPKVIVPREKKLSDNEKKLFTYFVKVPGMKEQLINTLCDVQMAAADRTSRTGNVIVMGGRESGKTRLISGLIPAICEELNLEASKVAYVFAEQINGRDIAKIVGKMSGGFLVIENANQLTQETVDQLDKAMEFRTDGLKVIIEDEKIGMRKLMARFPKFAKKFTSMINIPVFTNDELVNFAKVYTKENGYTIDQMGMLALYNLIGINQKEDEPMNIGAVKELIDKAIAKSQGGIRKLKRNISKRRTDRDGFIVLYEKDFS